MFAKLEITGTLEVKTGLHIGGSDAFAAIGAVDSPVIRDVRSGEPIIPGSSLKGKMRKLLAKYYNEKVASNPEEDAECIKSLFGSAKKGDAHTARLLFSDMFLENKDELCRANIFHATEVKFENKIKRCTAEANPRQIERVIRGAKFGLDLVYEYKNSETMLRDFEVLQKGFSLLQYDYLGGSGSRGYGKVEFYDIEIDPVIGEVDEDALEQCRQMLANL